jgi:membrane protease subunit HflK
MAWNEPGGNSNNQDPWGGRKGGGRQGPPDLDEALRKLQESLSGIFGGGKSRSGQGGQEGQGGGYGLLLVGLGILAAVWLYSAVYVVDEQEQAVVLRFGKYHETVGPGLNFHLPPIDRKFQENVRGERTYSVVSQMLTRDENIVEVPLTVQYNIGSLKDFVLQIERPEHALEQSTESAMRHVVGSTDMDQVLTEGRELIGNDVKVRLQSFLDTYGAGISVTQVNVQRATAPAEVRDAFDDVTRAREDEQREKNQAEAYANTVVPEARGQAQRALEDAQGYREEVVARAEGEAERFTKLLAEYQKAPEVTRERLYLDTMQDVMSSTSKVMIGGDGGQNSLLYLPLDKMLEGRTAAPAAVPAQAELGSRMSNEAQPRDPRSREVR